MNRKKSESRLMVILKVLLIKKQKVSLTLNLNKLSIFATPFKPLSLIKTDVDILFFVTGNCNCLLAWSERCNLKSLGTQFSLNY